MTKDNLTIRPLLQSDLRDFAACTAKGRLAQYMRFRQTTSLDEASALLEEYLQETAFAILIGTSFAGVFVFKGAKPGEYSLTTFLDEPFWGKGYATEVLKQMISFSKTELHAACLTAYVVQENTASCKVLEKCGFCEQEVLHFPDLPCGLSVFKKQVNS